MQQFVLLEYMDITCTEDDQEKEEFMENQSGHSSRKCRLFIKNAKMEKSDLILLTFAHYVKNFKFWVNVSGRPRWIHDEEIAKCVCNGLKPEFAWKMYARSFENLNDVRSSRSITYQSWYLKFQTEWKSLTPKRSLLKRKRYVSDDIKW